MKVHISHLSQVCLGNLVALDNLPSGYELWERLRKNPPTTVSETVQSQEASLISLLEGEIGTSTASKWQVFRFSKQILASFQVVDGGWAIRL
jgi:hypothetical protein